MLGGPRKEAEAGAGWGGECPHGSSRGARARAGRGAGRPGLRLRGAREGDGEAEGGRRAGRRAEAGRRDRAARRRDRVSVPAARLGSDGPERPGGGERPERAPRPSWWPTRASPGSRPPPSPRVGRAAAVAGRLAQRGGRAPARAVGRRGWRSSPATAARWCGASSCPRPGRSATSRFWSTPSRARVVRTRNLLQQLQARPRAALQPEPGGRATAAHPGCAATTTTGTRAC